MSTISNIKSQSVTNQKSGDNNDQISLLKQTPENIRFSTYKNVLVLSLGFLVQFTAFSGMKNLQSSINTIDDIGVNSLTIIHGCFSFSAACLAHSFIGLFGLKYTLLVCQIPFLLFVLANYNVATYVMIATAVIVGLAAGPLWTSAYSYVTDLACIYAQAAFVNKDATVSQFMAQIWGNLVAFRILTPERNINTNLTTFNSSLQYDKCGAHFSEQEYNEWVTGPPVDETTVSLFQELARSSL
ncbi:unnamed protein product [Adineta ricciae]|uniref:UNC93-like protein n=1 Tax=Adineta ricciae TaxID=249248 RepID=A0A814SYI6_ADIRI|nr:unnamed protein product [Adineta ricciae]